MSVKEDRFLEQLHIKETSVFRELFSEFYNSLVLFAMNYVEHQQVAEDIVQELFISVWEKNTRYASYNSFKTFLYHSVRNASLNYLKHKQVEEKYISSFLQEAEDEEEKLDLKMMEEELYRLLFQTIEVLPDKCKVIFKLHLDGKSNEEIATILKLSVMTVKTQKKRAMRCLREHLGQLYYILLAIHVI